MKFFPDKNKGYTLLFAVLTATLVLGVSVFILSVSTKQYQLAVAARESMYALYAADGAMECIANAIGVGDINVTVPPASGEMATIKCSAGKFDTNGAPQEEVIDDPFAAQPASTKWSEFSLTADVYVAELDLELPAGTCASVTIAKGYDRSTPEERPLLVADVRGYNYCDPDNPDERNKSTRTVERGLRLIKEL